MCVPLCVWFVLCVSVCVRVCVCVCVCVCVLSRKEDLVGWYLITVTVLSVFLCYTVEVDANEGMRVPNEGQQLALRFLQLSQLLCRSLPSFFPSRVTGSLVGCCWRSFLCSSRSFVYSFTCLFVCCFCCCRLFVCLLFVFVFNIDRKNSKQGRNINSSKQTKQKQNKTNQTTTNMGKTKTNCCLFLFFLCLLLFGLVCFCFVCLLLFVLCSSLAYRSFFFISR